MFSKICLNVLIGLPGAGKTTYANQVLQKAKEGLFKFNIIKISYDDYYTDKSNTVKAPSLGNDVKFTRHKILLLIELIVEELIQNTPNLSSLLSKCLSFTQENLHIMKTLEHFISSELSLNYLIILDDNNYYKSMRHEFKNIARKYNLGILYTFLDCDLEQCLLRNKCRPENSVIPKRVIQEMNSKIEKPAISDFRTFRLTDNFVIDFNELNSAIDESLEIPENYSASSYSKYNSIETTTIHQIDIILRKEVNVLISKAKFLSSNNKEEFKNVTTNLLDRRKEIIKSVKNGSVCIPANLEEIKELLN